MGRVQLRKDLYLLLDILNLIFCAFEVNDLDGDGFLGPLVIPECKDFDMEREKERRERDAPFENLSERTLACAVDESFATGRDGGIIPILSCFTYNSSGS